MPLSFSFLFFLFFPPGQRTLALQILAAILERVTRAGPPAYLLLHFLLDNHAAVIARCALDDKNLSHISCAAR